MKATMKANLILAAALALATLPAGADNIDPSGTQSAAAISAPKNLARQHLGANLMLL